MSLYWKNSSKLREVTKISSGVYAIKNNLNGKYYIGSSKNIEKRCLSHIRMLESNRHHSYKLQNAWNECPDKSVFSLEILELENEEVTRKAREEFFIKKYDGFIDGYNCTPYADNPKYSPSRYKNTFSYPTNEKFVWSVYHISQSLFPALNGSYITRLMFLSTYMNYDGHLTDVKNVRLSKLQIKALLGISDREFNRFYNKLISESILLEYESGIQVNPNIFTRGTLSPTDLAVLSKDEKYVTRIYINAIRKIYNTATIKSHKVLSYFFQVMPYVNREYNIVCHNPLEKDLEKIESMTLGEFADVIGYDKSNISRLCNILFSPTFKINGKEITAMRYVLNKSFDKNTYSMFINPRVYYAGNKWNEVEILGKF